MASEEVLRATIGGLLHDIGKVWAQGSKGDPGRSHWNCEGVSRCACRARFGYAHAAMGGHLVADIFGAGSPYAELVALHHSLEGRDIPLARFVQEGDYLSAGERDDNWDSDEEHPDSLPFLIPPLAGRTGSAYRVRPRSLDEVWPPIAPLGNETQLAAREWYDRLAQRLVAGGRSLPTLSGDAQVDAVLGLVENICSLVPSAFWKTKPDISLATHLQLAAAFAGALAAVGEPDADPCATLVAGDLSGIQAFLHRAATERAARQLRARSFYLSLLALVVARTLARELGVTPAHVVTASGGNFLVIAPPGSSEKAREVADQITKQLRDVHGPVLDVLVASDELRRADTRSFADAVARVRQKLQRRKLRRYAPPATFEPRGTGGTSEACRACGADGAKKRGGAGQQDDRFCDFCWGLVELGRQLPDRNFLTLGLGNERRRDWREAFAALGWQVELHNSSPSEQGNRSLFVLDAEELKSQPHARLFVTGRYVPRQRNAAGNESVVEFGELAGSGPGRPVLAAAKLDVDDLGRFFASLGEDKAGAQATASPSRFASASRFFSLFFEGHVDVAAGRRREQDIYLVYSGGDDAALVGHWRAVIEFVRDLRRDFDSWTGDNPDLHFSAGVAFGADDQPLILALTQAEEALQRAKLVEGKDRCTLFYVPFGWDEVDAVVEWVDRLAALVQTASTSPAQRAGLSRGALQVLRAAEAAIDEREPLGKPRYGPTMWRIPYRMRRAFRGPGAEAEAFAAAIEQELLTNGGPARLAAAARLAAWQTWNSRDDQSSLTVTDRRTA